MTLSIRNSEADRLARQLAEFEEKPITEAVIIALKEALKARRNRETMRQSAERIAKRHGITLPAAPSAPIPREEIYDLLGETLEWEATQTP